MFDWIKYLIETRKGKVQRDTDAIRALHEAERRHEVVKKKTEELQRTAQEIKLSVDQNHYADGVKEAWGWR